MSGFRSSKRGRFINTVINKCYHSSFDEYDNSSRHLQSLSKHVFRNIASSPEFFEIFWNQGILTGFPSLRRCWRTTQVVIALFFVSILTCLFVTVVRVLDASDKLNLWYSRSLTSTETAGSNDVTSFETYFLKISKFRDWIASCNESNAFQKGWKKPTDKNLPARPPAWAVFRLQRRFRLPISAPIWFLVWLLPSWNFGFASSSRSISSLIPNRVRIYSTI